jgi:hypothetical protein
LGKVEDYQEFEQLYAANHPKEQSLKENTEPLVEKVDSLQKIEISKAKTKKIDPLRKEWLNTMHSNR